MTGVVIGGGGVARPLADDPPGDERPYTKGQLKALLVAWGATVADRYGTGVPSRPTQGDLRSGAATRGRSQREIVGTTINAGRKHGPKLPVPAEFTDVSIAFANLNPAHRRLGWDGDRSWLQHVPLTKQQLVLWEKYVVGALDRPDELPPAHTGNPVADDLGEDAYARAEERRARLGHPREGTSDRAVAGRLGWSEKAVRYHADGALDALLAEINDLAGRRRRG